MRPWHEKWVQAGAESNRRRAQTVGQHRAEAIDQLLADGLDVDDGEREILTVRADHPDKSLAEIAGIAGMTKYAYASALRRTLLSLGAW